MHEISFMVNDKIVDVNQIRKKMAESFPGYQHLKIKNNIEVLTENNLLNLKIDTLFEQINIIRQSEYWNDKLFSELESLYTFYKQNRVLIFVDETEDQMYALMKGKKLLLSEISEKVPLKMKIQEIQGAIGMLTFQLGQITQELRENK